MKANAETAALALNLTWHQVSTAGSVVWVMADVLCQGRVEGQNIEFPLRLTNVLEKRGDNWFVVQSHVTSPAIDQEKDESVPV